MVSDTQTVLLVDDEEDVVEIYALALQDEYEVLRAYSGSQALDLIDESVDVVLLDRRMPGLSGNDVLEEIRDRDLTVRVAMVTAVDPNFDIAEMDFDAYMTKPVSDEEIRSVVDELMTLSTYDDRTGEIFATAQKIAALEAEKTQQELSHSEEYQALKDRFAELESESSSSLADMDARTFEKTLAPIPKDESSD